MAGNMGGYVGVSPSRSVGAGGLLSGAVVAGAIGSGAIVSGNIASGQVGNFHVASGQMQGLAGAGVPNVASGSLNGFELGSGSVVSGRIASGQIGSGHLDAGLLAGIGTNSGTVVRASQFVAPFHVNTSWSLITEEIISGVRAVCVSQSGNLRVAMASVSGRMPAIGVVVDGVLSGIAANVYTQGAFLLSSGLADYSGFLGKPVWVGRSGQVVTFSGSWNSGGFDVASGGDFVQRFGVAHNSGGFVVQPDNTLLQNQLIGVNDLVDVVNRGFGV